MFSIPKRDMKKKNIYKIFGIICYSIFSFILIGEFLVSYFAPQRKYVEKDLYQPDCFIGDTISGFRLLPHTSCHFQNLYKEYDTDLHTNSLGYRGKEFTIKKDESTKRILLLGDSFALGYGVSDDETIAVKLEQNLQQVSKQKVDVINAGYRAGFTVDTYYSYLIDQGFALKPDTVVMTIFPYNDIAEILESKWTVVDERGLPRKVELLYRDFINGRMVRKIKELQYKLPILRDSNLYLFLLNTVKHYYPSIGNMTVDNPKGFDKVGCILSPSCADFFSDEEEKFYKILLAIKEETKKRNIQFLIVLIPADYQLYPFAFQKYQSQYAIDRSKPNYMGEKIQNRLMKNSIPVIDTYIDLKHNESSGGAYPYFVQDGHFNSVGTQIAANAITKDLENRQWINIK
jgi:hypothetical protein